MKTNALIAGAAIAVANAAVLIGSLEPFTAHIQAGSIAFGLWLILRAVLTKEAPASAVEAPAEESPSAVPPAIVKNQAETEIVAFLGAFQEKGRFVDFLMDDIAAYGDAQVGAAARVVHQGCQSVLKDHFKIVPVSEDKEGAMIEVPSGASKSDYRLSGRIEGEGPFAGKLVHKGWRTEMVKLPRIAADEERLPAIAAAQVEIR